MKLVTNNGHLACFWALLGTENPFPPTHLYVHRDHPVEVEDEVWSVVEQTLAEQGETVDTYGLTVEDVS